MARVLGVGGIFFLADRPAVLARWYARHLGIALDEQGDATFRPTRLPAAANCVWAPFARDNDCFAPARQPFMFNLIVDDLAMALRQAEAGGAVRVGSVETYPCGRFGWFLDPEGNKVEFWQLAEGTPPGQGGV